MDTLYAHGDSLTFLNVRQWTRLVFYIEFGDGTILYTPLNYWDQIIDPAGLVLSFNKFGSSDPSAGADFALVIALAPDSSLDAIPSSEILNDIANPFIPTDVIAPISGHAFLTIDGGNPTNPQDSLYMELPSQKLLMSNAPAAAGDTIDLGEVTCGEPLRFYLRSGKPIVAGMNLYPQVSDSIAAFPGDGTEVDSSLLSFDDWTDLVFDKLNCTFYVVSDTTNVVVQVVPSELSPGDTATVVLENYQNCGLTAFPPGQLFEVGIDSGNAYGTILSSGDTAGYFASIPQPFQFIASDSINADSVMVGIRVGEVAAAPPAASTTPGWKGVNKKVAILQNKSVSSNVRTSSIANGSVLRNSLTVKSAAKAGKKSVSSVYDFTSPDYGTCWVEVKKPTLTIVNHAPWSIWPYLPPVHLWIPNPNGHGRMFVTEVYPSNYNYKRGFTISVTDAEGNPVPNAAVEIRHDYQQGSGGHAHGYHDDNPLTPPQKLQGTFYGPGKSDSLLELTTDANGIAVVDSLVASQISGTYLITAYLVSDPSVKDTVNLNVQVPELAHFGDWILIPSGETQPWTFYQSDSGNANHPNNNYCTIAMGDSLAFGIFDFYDWSSSDSAGNGGIPITLSLNDMSLPWGGVFDIYDTWQPDHKWHRIGRSVDINNPGRIFQYPDTSDSTRPILTELGKKLEYWMEQHHGYRVTEGKSVHYEFYKAY